MRALPRPFVFLMAGRPSMRGRSEFAAAQSMQQQLDIAANSEIQEIKVFGDWAYVWTQLSVGVTPKGGGAPVRRAGPTLSILHKRDGAWLMFRDANMLSVVS